MPDDSLSVKDFSRALHDCALAWIVNRTASLGFAQPPLNLPAAWRVEARPAPLLRREREAIRTPLGGTHWIEAGLNSSRYACLICVFEGEADFRIGVTARMAAQNPAIDAKRGCYVVSLPQRSFLLIPPGVPFSDGSRPHWERAHIEAARSRLLWFHVLPAGFSLHICATRGTTHESSGGVFAQDTHLIQIMEAMSEEMSARLLHADAIAMAHLEALLLRIARGLSSALPLSGVEKRKLFSGEGEPNSAHDKTPAIARACRYIETHLNQPLSVERIASRTYVSAPHLSRLFRSEMKTSVMQYVALERVEMAKSLLRDTDLPIQRVCAMSGYIHPSHFSRSFSQATGLTPLAFRRRERALPSPPPAKSRKKAAKKTSP